MTLIQVQPAGLCRHRAPIKDKQMPNFLFSSDIPHKISQCVAELHLYRGGYNSMSVDLAEYIRCFELTLELNALLLRNKDILPSELVQNNSIFVAKWNVPAFNQSISSCRSLFPDVWKAILSTLNANEIFVVSFRLELDHFQIDLSNKCVMSLRFHANKTIQPLLLSDIAVHLETYIQQTLLQELQKVNDISVEIKHSSTILQDLPPSRSIALFHSLYGNSCNKTFGLAIDSSDEGDISCMIEKQLVCCDDDDFENTDDEIKILHSDESGKFQSNEEEDLDFADTPFLHQTSILGREDPDLFVDEISSISLSGDSRPFESSATANRSKIIKKHSSFIPILDNNSKVTLQKYSLLDSCEEHSDCVKTCKIDGASPKPSILDTKLTPGAEAFSKLTYNPGANGSSKTVSEFITECDDMLSSPMVSPKKRNTPSLTTEGTGEASQLRKKVSISFIDHDEGLGLQFAFRDSSSSVPEYIKEDKKFKFIKVGKVQKFVSMFEEHKESVSNSLSRVGTRPGSPVSYIE